MSKLFRVLGVLGSSAALVATGAAAAQAKPFHITGKQTTITPSSQAAQVLTSNGVTVSAIGPATLSGGTLTLPIDGGRAARSGQRGVVLHAGGVEFSKGKRHIALRHLVLAGNINHPRLSAGVAGRRIVIARLSNAQHSSSGNTVTLSGELLLSRHAARAIDRRFGKQVVSPGADLGSLTSTITVA
jgi:hypothetical protein